MITGQQLLDAIVHADEWPDELMRLRKENAELHRQLDAERARAQREQANGGFLFSTLFGRNEGAQVNGTAVHQPDLHD